jgi:Uma2 family endonuclease
MTALPKTKLDIGEFVAWSAKQPSGRYELQDGAVVAMSPESNRHLVTKKAVCDVLSRSLAEIESDCLVFPDGAGVIIDKDTLREPDASIHCGPYDPDAVTIDNPVVVVEVLSPNTMRTDSITKVDDYFRVGSIRHYLIVDPFNRLVIHFCRDKDGISRKVHDDGAVRLDPPGIEFPVASIFGSVSN